MFYLQMAVLIGLAIVLLCQFVQGYPYSYSPKRYSRASYRPSYMPLPMAYSLSQAYDDSQQESPLLYYYPYRTDRRLVYFDDPSDVGDMPEQTGYPFGQEMWYEGGENALSAAANAAATREAILQNLLYAQLYEDAAANAVVSGVPYYQLPSEDYENKDWKYGVPTSGLDEKERARQYLKNEEDEDVKELKELENIRKAKEAQSKGEGKRRRKQKNKEMKQDNEAKRVKEIREAMGMAIAKRQPLFSTVLTTERPSVTEKSLTETTVGRNSVSGGQKEVVLPQPARPIRRPFNELSQRLHARSEEPSVYQTIKQLLAMEGDYQKVSHL